MPPKVSLLVPVFNRAELVSQAIESALTQTENDVEVVVVDGASTDRTWEVCLGYAAADHRVRVFRDEMNTGPVRGWWRCVEEARGTYATFLWSDDLLMPTFLERTAPFLSDERVAFAFTAAEIGSAPGAGRVSYAHAAGLMPSKKFITGSLASRGRYPLSPACALFRLGDIRRNFVTELPTDPSFDLTATGAGTDLLLYLMAASERPLVAHINEPLAFFRAHGGSISVDGRGGQVALSYATTKCWFAQTRGKAELVPTVVAWHWLDQMRSSRRFLPPPTTAKQGLPAVTGTGLIGALCRIMAAIARDRLMPRSRAS